MKRQITLLCAILLLLVLIVPAVQAQEYTLWQSAWTVKNNASELLIIGSGPSSYTVRLSAPSVGVYRANIPVYLPSNVIVKSVTICYDLSNAASYIDEIDLSEMIDLGPAVTWLQDPTDLTSTTPTCYTTVAPFSNPYFPGGSMTITVVMNFNRTSHVIDIGAVGITVEPAP